GLGDVYNIQDLLIYTLGGQDAAFFRISRNDGQLRTRAPLNYEVRSTYTVEVTATDPFGAADSIVVTIVVTDVDDPPVITVLTVGGSQAGELNAPEPDG
ncbi:MAG: cadherin repeat domain-containing protein, partial [Gammaproteobacteria bacterium]|nr:cadherin repeat domain-containing protein [Gammaproteobacteria bacterium]